MAASTKIGCITREISCEKLTLNFNIRSVINMKDMVVFAVGITVFMAVLVGIGFILDTNFTSYGT
tara:strand:+ start:196 stop:390 length:195 start_codon:yes stop_codon:yes gene_type:complete